MSESFRKFCKEGGGSMKLAYYVYDDRKSYESSGELDLSRAELDTDSCSVKELGDFLENIMSDNDPMYRNEVHILVADGEKIESPAKNDIRKIIAAAGNSGEVMAYLHQKYGMSDDWFPEICRSPEK